MSELATTVLDRLIEKTFEAMTQAEQLAFIEKLFQEMPAESQERLLRQLIVERQGHPARAVLPLPWEDEGLQPRNIGPWMACCRMMVRIDEAGTAESLDAGTPARLFNALADETRLRIVKLLMEGEKRVEELTQALNSAQSTVSHHLRILRQAGLVRGRRDGRSTYYTLA